MLFMGVSVPDAANVCNESKVESYDTDIKYCPEFYAENEKENTTESDSDINSDILEDDSVIGSLNEITKDKSDVTFYDIYESLKSGDVDSTIDMALKVFSDSVIYEVRTSRGLALQIIAVIVLGSTFAQLAGNMGEYVSAHGFTRAVLAQSRTPVAGDFRADGVPVLSAAALAGADRGRHLLRRRHHAVRCGNDRHRAAAHSAAQDRTCHPVGVAVFAGGAVSVRHCARGVLCV